VPADLGDGADLGAVPADPVGRCLPNLETVLTLGSVPADPVTRSFGMMLVGMTPSTQDGRRKLLTGVDGGEFTGEMETRSGADPLRFDAATDIPHPSSSDGFPPDDSPGRAAGPSSLSVKQSSELLSRSRAENSVKKS